MNRRHLLLKRYACQSHRFDDARVCCMYVCVCVCVCVCVFFWGGGGGLWVEIGTARSNYNKKSPVAVASPRGDDGRDVSRNSNEALGREGLHVKTPAIHRVI